MLFTSREVIGGFFFGSSTHKKPIAVGALIMISSRMSYFSESIEFKLEISKGQLGILKKEFSGCLISCSIHLH